MKAKTFMDTVTKHHPNAVLVSTHWTQGIASNCNVREHPANDELTWEEVKKLSKKEYRYFSTHGNGANKIRILSSLEDQKVYRSEFGDLGWIEMEIYLRHMEICEVLEIEWSPLKMLPDDEECKKIYISHNN